MECAVVGTGYVGLVTGACLAELGHSVICVDRDSSKIEDLSKAHVPIYEAELENLVRANLKSGRLSFTTDIREAVRESLFVFITVDTPSDDSGGADLTHLDEVSREIARSIDSYRVVVNKSTVPVGTTRRVERLIKECMEEYHEFDVVSNPEFLREGTSVSDFMNPSRIVIGSDSQKAIMLMTELYREIDAPLLVTDPVSAEMIKYASNSFLATKVSYINAIANICEVVGADVREVALGMGYDPRIGFEFLKPGPGFGGSCFPKDCRALIKISKDHGYHFKLLEGVLDVNEEQHKRIVDKVVKAVGDLEGKRIGVLGLAFKANTDDVRESPAVKITRMMAERGAIIKAYDPKAMENATAELEGAGVSFASDAYEVAEGSSILVFLAGWDEFKWLDFSRIKKTMASPVVVDARNCLDPQVLRKLGFVYEGVGR
ncbi:MAG: UDP-glucose/GDP-mannose dehydrogenase family protein [Actinomycetota bacterium]|nr:UDP-glucose/GDP-mannose dehydrogenase family protein [Actinomycetota bacterium]